MYYEENSDYLSSLKSFRVEFTDKDGFTIVKKDVFVQEMTVMINGKRTGITVQRLVQP